MPAQKKLMWIGPVVPSALTRDFPAVSPAGNGWQLKLIESVAQLGWKVEVAGALPEPVFPRGKLWLEPRRWHLGDRAESSTLRSLNLPRIRDVFQGREIERWLRDRWSPGTAIVSYNLPRSVRWIPRSAYRQSWTPIIADIYTADDFRAVVDTVKMIGRAVCLAHGLASDLKRHGDVLHLDGGIQPPVERSTAKVGNRVPLLSYNGSLGPHGGLAELVAAVNELEENCCELVISGKGNPGNLLKKLRGNVRVDFKGYLGTGELVSLMKEVDVFVNPRPDGCFENTHNFPSKLLEYLRWAKPIVSTITPGVDPVYRQFVIAADGGVAGLRAALEKAISLTAEERDLLADRCLDFAARHSWSIQAQRFCSWIENRLPQCK